MLLVVQNSTKPFNIYFGVSGLSITATLSKNGGAFNSVSPTITDRSNGYYSITPIAAHRDTLGENAWLFAASGQTSVPRVEQVGLTDVDVAAAGAATPATVFNHDIDTDDYPGSGNVNRAGRILFETREFIENITTGLTQVNVAPDDITEIRSGLATATNVDDAETAILAKLPESGRASTLTAQQVWEYIVTGSTSAATGLTTLLGRIIGTLASGTHQPQSGDAFARLGAPAGASIAADIAALDTGTGTGARTVTPTVRVSGVALEGATVRMVLGSEAYTGTTNSSGQVTFNLDDGTYTVSISKPGYSFAGTTLVVDGTETPIYNMAAISVSTPADPALATLTVKCLDKAGAAEPGAKVYVRLVGIPSGSTGLSFDGISSEATANSEGNATLTIVKLAKYQIRRGGTQQWKDFTAGSADSQTIPSFIGVDPA